jgi:hypothetical protein
MQSPPRLLMRSKQPLSAIITRAETGLRWLERLTPELDRVREQFAEVAADRRRAVAVMDGIRANFKKDPRIRSWLDVNMLIEETLTLIQGDLQQHRILVHAVPRAQIWRWRAGLNWFSQHPIRPDGKANHHICSLSLHMVHTKALCTGIATFILCIPHPANASAGNFLSQFSDRCVSDVMKRRERYTFTLDLDPSQ